MPSSSPASCCPPSWCVVGSATFAAVASLLAACGGEVSPAAPGPISGGDPFQSVSSGTVSGTVLDVTSGSPYRPVPNLSLSVWHSSADGRVGASRVADITSDGEGRYSLSGLSVRLLWVEAPPGAPYTFLCPAYPLYLLGRSVNLPVVPASWAGNALPGGLTIPHTSVYGTVTDSANGAPLAGAVVTLDHAVQDPPATTNASGFYMVCSFVGSDQTRTITAAKDGYVPSTREIFGGWDFLVPFALDRR